MGRPNPRPDPPLHPSPLVDLPYGSRPHRDRRLTLGLDSVDSDDSQSEVRFRKGEELQRCRGTGGVRDDESRGLRRKVWVGGDLNVGRESGEGWTEDPGGDSTGMYVLCGTIVLPSPLHTRTPSPTRLPFPTGPSLSDGPLRYPC